VDGLVNGYDKNPVQKILGELIYSKAFEITPLRSYYRTY
jgi:hypothetical protein